VSIRVAAFAKLNLSLRVIGRRDDGYHEIGSTVQTVDLADEIALRVTQGVVRVRNEAVTGVGPDLTEQAARALLERKGVRGGVEIDVLKRIPIGGGLGGGSSDAAAVLVALNPLVPPVLSPQAVVDLASELGSDVPLFLRGGLVRMEGRGERITALGSPRSETFVILCPPIHCDTSRVYANWTANRSGGRSEPRFGENDLLAPALAAYPGLAKYYEAMAATSAEYFGMSGSGSSMYGAFSTADAAAAASAQLATVVPNARTFVCGATASGSRVLGGSKE